MKNLLCSIAVACCVFAVGCSSEEGAATKPTYPVTGTLTHKGKTVEGATIVLIPTDEQGASATATTDASGKFAFTTFKLNDGVASGNYLAKVFKYPAPPAASAGGSMTQEEFEKAYKPDNSQPPPSKHLLPEKYASEATSGLKLTVDKEPKTYDIELK